MRHSRSKQNRVWHCSSRDRSLLQRMQFCSRGRLHSRNQAVGWHRARDKSVGWAKDREAAIESLRHPIHDRGRQLGRHCPTSQGEHVTESTNSVPAGHHWHAVAGSLSSSVLPALHCISALSAPEQCWPELQGWHGVVASISWSCSPGRQPT
jgi:hypothetical protein